MGPCTFSHSPVHAVTYDDDVQCAVGGGGPVVADPDHYDDDCDGCVQYDYAEYGMLSVKSLKNLGGPSRIFWCDRKS